MMPERVGTRDVILLPDDTTATKYRRRAADAQVGLADTGVGHAMTTRSQRACNHDPAEVREHLQDVANLRIEVRVLEARYRGGCGGMNAGGGAVFVDNGAKYSGSGVDKTVPKSGAANCSWGASQQLGDMGGTAHVERVLEKGAVDELGGPTSLARLDLSHNKQGSGVRGVNGLVTSRIEVVDHTLYAGLERVVLLDWEQIAMLPRTTVR